MSYESNSKFTVFYDGACPLCTKEISFYKKLDAPQKISWVDITKLQGDNVAPGLSKTEALARFHILDTNGKLHSGAQAFSRLWCHIPYFKYLGHIFQIWPLSWLAEMSYKLFLKFRPTIQSLIKR